LLTNGWRRINDESCQQPLFRPLTRWHVVDTLAPVYVPMIQRVVDGELQILGVGGWGADCLSLEQNLLQAIKRKQVAIVHAFFAKGADPDTRDERGKPAIIWAVASGQPEIVQFLLEKGADPTATDPEGVSALGLATERREMEIIGVLEQVRNDAPDQSDTAPAVAGRLSR